MEANMKTLKPINDNVVVKPDDKEGLSKEGLTLPDSAQKPTFTGKVVATGPGRMNDQGVRLQMAVMVGDTVLYSKYGGSDVTVDGEDFTILAEDQIKSVVVEV